MKLFHNFLHGNNLASVNNVSCHNNMLATTYFLLWPWQRIRNNRQGNSLTSANAVSCDNALAITHYGHYSAVATTQYGHNNALATTHFDHNNALATTHNEIISPPQMQFRVSQVIGRAGVSVRADSFFRYIQSETTAVASSVTENTNPISLQVRWDNTLHRAVSIRDLFLLEGN